MLQSLIKVHPEMCIKEARKPFYETYKLKYLNPTILGIGYDLYVVPWFE